VRFSEATIAFSDPDGLKLEVIGFIDDPANVIKFFHSATMAH
jgi:hypothetical protein